MSLKVALLLVGVIIIISVAVGVTDRSSIRRSRSRRQRQSGGQDGPGSGQLNDGATSMLSIELPENLPAGSIRKSPSALEKRKLKTNTPAAKPLGSTQDRIMREEIESYEQVADLRLDVDPNIDGPVIEADEPKSPLQQDYPTVADKIVDFTISLPGKKVISRNRALGLFKQNEYMLDKPRSIYGLRRVTRVWTNIESDPDSTEYEDLMLALQMVDDKGSVGETELNTFVQMGLKFGDRFKRRTLFSLGVDEAVVVAQGLDEFCKQHDVIASINVVANSPMGFPGNTIAAVANDLGLRFGDMNIFHQNDAMGQLQYSMANLFRPGNFDRDNLEKFRTKGLTLFMQVPCVLDCVKVFGGMIDTAMNLADRMGGRLVDQDMKTLTESGINTIRRQIDSIATDMRTRGINPGSEAALRLFHV